MVMVNERQLSIIEKTAPEGYSGEVTVTCPACKAFQTLSFAKGNLVPTRKFSQLNGRVYHDCGSKERCRLYRLY
jgi:hypothetical protein